MRLAEDRRARVPFALVGIVLLLGSATYVATVGQRGPPDTGPDVVEARERLGAAVDTVVRQATVRAATRAARNPVVATADTPAGRELDDDDPFREYLELRVYLAVRRALSNLTVRVGEVTATAALPAPDGARDAIERVAIARGDENASVDVRVENVTLRVRRHGRTVVRRDVTVGRPVATPVLALHDRVRRFQQLLDAGLANTSGLAARVAGLLYPYAWARGYMQYAGAPVENVVANRHLAVATNVGLQAIQRGVFGRDDPAAEAALHRAATMMLAQDAGSAAGNHFQEKLDRLVAAKRNASYVVGGLPSFPTGPSGVPSPRSDVTVDVNRSADLALAAFLNGSAEPRALDDVFRNAYSAHVRLQAARTTVRSGSKPGAEPPGDDWTLVSAQVSKQVSVFGGDGPLPDLADDWHRVSAFTRRVEVTRTVVRVWSNDSATRRHRKQWSEVLAVGVALDARHSPVGWVPRNGIRTVHERGKGPLDGPNLAGIPGKARERLVADPGKAALAKQAALGTLDEGMQSLLGERPEGRRAFVRPALIDLRGRLRNVSTSVSRGEVGTGQANAASELVAEIRARRAELVDAPRTYDSVAHKARVAARAAYVDAVIARLEGRSTRTRKRNEGLAEVLSTFDLSLESLQHAIRAGPSTPRAGRPMFTDGLAGPVNVTVAGDPPYLTRAAVTDEQVRAVTPSTAFHPLRTKNLNVFTMPYGDAADVVVDRMMGDTNTANLRAAAKTLRAANATLAETDDEQLRAKRDDLQVALARAVSRTKRRLARTLGAMTRRFDSVSLSASERSSLVDGAVAEWGTTADRALAVANGSLASTLAAAVDEQTGVPAGGRGLLALEFRFALHDAATSNDVRPPRPLVNSTGRAARTVVRNVAADISQEAFNRTFEHLQEKYEGKYKLVPAGLPITPIPGSYYAVANLWVNDVRGTYASFTVSAKVGSAAGPTTVSYRRDGGRVELDVDGDGSRELLGWSRRVSFEFLVPVVVVVPPTPTGLGDRDGNMDERSGGWSTPPPLVRNTSTK